MALAYYSFVLCAKPICICAFIYCMTNFELYIAFIVRQRGPNFLLSVDGDAAIRLKSTISVCAPTKSPIHHGNFTPRLGAAAEQHSRARHAACAHEIEPFGHSPLQIQTLYSPDPSPPLRARAIVTPTPGYENRRCMHVGSGTRCYLMESRENNQ